MRIGKGLLLLASTVASVLAASCGGDGTAEATSTPGGTVVATQSPGTTRTVIPGITRDVTNTGTPSPPPPPPPAAGPPSADTVTIEEAWPGLPQIARPVVMVEVPGQETFLVVSQDGVVHAFPHMDGASELTEVLDWTDETSRDGNEEGLLGLALSPTFESDGYVFLYYSAADPRRSVTSRFETSGSGTGLRIDPGSELIILEVAQPYSNHNGGNLVFGPDGMLYIGLGDGGDGGDPHGHGQDPTTLLGSMLRIDVSQASVAERYRIPSDNPFVGDSRARPETFAYGFRNPWRYSFDRETGDLWLGDVGQGSREEIDLVVAGGNYGWNIMEGFECYRDDGCNRSGLELPVVDYPTSGGSCAVTGGYVARGTNAGTLTGWYVYGDYCGGTVWALDAAQAGSNPEPVLLQREGPQLASFAEDLDGNLYILAFNGLIYRITG